MRILIIDDDADYRQLLRTERIPFTGVSHDNVDTVRINVRNGEDVNRVASLLRRRDTTSQGSGHSVTASTVSAPTPSAIRCSS